MDVLTDAKEIEGIDSKLTTSTLQPTLLNQVQTSNATYWTSKMLEVVTLCPLKNRSNLHKAIGCHLRLTLGWTSYVKIGWPEGYNLEWL